MMCYKLLYLLGVKRRNPSLLSYLDLLNESNDWSLDQLQAYQLKKTKDLLVFAQKHAPFYQQLFASIAFDPTQIKTIEELKLIPAIDKNSLLNNVEQLQARYKFNKLIFSETSGTSGQVLQFFRNEEWDSHNRAAMFRAYAWYGVHPWERNGYFWGYNVDKKQKQKTVLLDRLQNRFRLFSYEEQNIHTFVEKLKRATYLSGYSSMIYEVAKIVNRLGIGDMFDLKMIKGTSEKIYDNYQEEVKKAFGKKIISEYGAAETGLIAFECPEGGNMHINMENVVVEEEDGEIIVTNLLSYAFPIIRYRLGDVVKLAPKDFKCPCGRSHPVILDVLGRVGKNIVGQTTTYPSLSFYYVFKNLALNNSIALNYQAVQTVKGKVLIKIEQNSPKYLPALKVELEKYFHSDIAFEIKWGETLHAMDGKLKDFITTLN